VPGPSKSTQTTTNMLDPWTWSQLTGTFSPDQVLGLQGLMGDWYNRTREGINPQGQLDAANNYFQRIAAPSVSNQMAAAGLGRSGAQAEALSNAGVQMALPIQQNASNQLFNLNSMLPQIALNALNMSTGQNTQKSTVQQGGNMFSSLMPLAMMAAMPFTGGMSGLGIPTSMGAAGFGPTAISYGTPMGFMI
jgi:hypothetical protein